MYMYVLVKQGIDKNAIHVFNVVLLSIKPT